MILGRGPCGPASGMCALCSCASALQASWARYFSTSLLLARPKYCTKRRIPHTQTPQDGAQSRASRAAERHLERGGFAAASHTDELQQQRAQQHAHLQSSASKRTRALRIGCKPSSTRAAAGCCGAASAERTSFGAVMLARVWRRLCRRIGCQRQPCAKRVEMSTDMRAMKNEQLGREDWALPQPTSMVEVDRVAEQRGAAAWGALGRSEHRPDPPDTPDTTRSKEAAIAFL